MESNTNANQLFQTAYEEGTLSAGALQTLSNIIDVSAQIQAALGVNVDDVRASEVTLVTMMIDDSGSIRFAGNSQIVRDGHNLVIEALRDSKQESGIMCHTRYLNGYILYPYCALSDVILMDSQNYNPREGTPLYDQSIILLGTVIAKAQEFSQNGVPVRTVTLIVTDGKDEHSRRARPKNVATLVKDMLKTETHVVAAMGIDDGTMSFREVFHEMGILDEWILTPGNTPSEIRHAFGAFSKSAVRASQSAKSFSQTALGSFGAP